MREPFGVFHHAVKLVAVQDPVFLAVGGFIDHVRHQFDTGHVVALEPAQGFDVVAGDIKYLGPVFGHLQHTADHVVMGGVPVPGALQLPAVDDVPHKEKLVATDGLQEIQQEVHPRGPCAEVGVRYKNSAIVTRFILEI